jgi:hypothetical protein
LYITNYHGQANGGDALVSIKINGTTKAQYLTPSTAGLQQYRFGDGSPMKATSGQTVTIVAESGSSLNKTYYASFNGYEE